MPPHDRPRRVRRPVVSPESEPSVPRARRAMRLSVVPAPSPPTAPDPEPPVFVAPPLSPRSKLKHIAACWTRARLLDDQVSAKDKLALPRGYGMAGLRFDKKGLQARAKLLRPLVHPDKHAGEGEEELALWTSAFQALESALTIAMDEWGPTPRRAAQKPRNGGGDDPLRVLANRREKTDADVECAEFWLSGTHAVKKRKGQGDVTTHERLLILNGFLDWFATNAPALQEAGFFMSEENTRNLAMERGEENGHHHGQSLIGVMWPGPVEEAADALASVLSEYPMPVVGRVLEHRIHDKGANRSVRIAIGYTTKDGGGGVQSRRPHFRSVGNLTSAFEKAAFDEWFSSAGDTQTWGWEKTGFDTGRAGATARRS